MNYYTLLPFTTFLINLFFVFYLIIVGSKDKVHKAYLCFSISLALWCVSDVILWWHDSSDQIIFLFFKIQLIFQGMVNFSFITFLQYLVFKKTNKYCQYLLWGYTTTIVLLSIVDFTYYPLVQSFERLTDGTLHPIVNPHAYIAAFVNIIGISTFILVLLYTGYKQNAKGSLIHHQVKVIIHGAVTSLILMFSLVIVFKLVLNIEAIPITPSTLTVVLSIFIFYGIIKYKLLTIGVTESAGQIFSKIYDGVVILDHEGFIVNINDVGKTMLSVHGELKDTYFGAYLSDFNYSNDVKDKTLEFEENGNRKTLLYSQSPLIQSDEERGKLIILKDITKLVENEKEIKSLNSLLKSDLQKQHTLLHNAKKEIVENEHQKNIAEIAAGALHNVKNILSHIKVSAHMISDSIHGEEIVGLRRALEMVHTQKDLEEFLHKSPKVLPLLKYLAVLHKPIKEECTKTKDKARRILESVDTIEDLINAQQRYGGKSIIEETPVKKLIDDALIIEGKILNNTNVKIIKNIDTVPDILIHKSKFISVLDNIIKNAAESMISVDEERRQLSIYVAQGPDNMAILKIRDTGCGISPENLSKMFTYGFTTKKDGHGFGLNSCLKYMKEMGGDLKVSSKGVGKGTTFTLFVPTVLTKVPTPTALTH